MLVSVGLKCAAEHYIEFLIPTSHIDSDISSASMSESWNPKETDSDTTCLSEVVFFFPMGPISSGGLALNTS